MVVLRWSFFRFASKKRYRFLILFIYTILLILFFFAGYARESINNYELGIQKIAGFLVVLVQTIFPEKIKNRLRTLQRF